MSGPVSGFKVGFHSRINTGDASDQVSVAQHPGWIDGIQAFNMSSATVIFLKLYDSSAAISTALTPFWRGPIPFSGSLSTGSLADIPAAAGFTIDTNNPWPFNNGLGYALATTLADNTNTTAAANLAIINFQIQTSTTV